MRKAFTLVELLVVIGIVAVLIGVLLSTFSSSSEAALSAKCMSNLRNLATVWNSQQAGSQEHIEMSLTFNSPKSKFIEKQGWISSDTRGLYPSESHQTFSPISMYETDVDTRNYALTNGWMCAAVGHNESMFICPSHLKAIGSGVNRPCWSYLMNAYFGWDAAQGGHSYNPHIKNGNVNKGTLTNAERLLLFAEVPFRGPGEWFVLPDGNGSPTDTDAILQYDGCNTAPTAVGKDCFNGQENIGGNHKSGKDWFAHVAFADGHVEKLNVTGLSASNLKQLTTWLCEGKAVAREGDDYVELK